MDIGKFNKECAESALECIKAIMAGIPKSKLANLAGEFNELCLFMEAAKRAAPEK